MGIVPCGEYSCPDAKWRKIIPIDYVKFGMTLVVVIFQILVTESLQQVDELYFDGHISILPEI